ncbi:PTS lactose/cellobiose transporter subunit IIA [Liquorilactobacillus nagelii]|jgi:PTS system cellobiose-specific IIA component|uniref:PTS lactose/cellobiose transporter subunit IIA n=1 Tax=Liquorilactobacillus nagelii TaxID=82688 RepID=UPI0006F091E7|nr:PTS lactose/cellobiose transporter subunit IIA [Liquorilactobacillus nagelii]KRL40302.1 hypothetical protein FD45_GL002410 [Liquorilactobacillus nagelii DSM 13675]MCI1699213.1 PTS lactose/cellobiose transporter subunit IIA [Liquorilactobacillus nagelii]MCI1977661.1 PTS lactose/cellobiose transporter subunit IIA [Liquorilactobacillus nagelii]QYH54800.1 PTS lactose/cellobiose transporter subunit IIA [Liquorilactobacillus nagelii DSM 13675]ULQ48734.1 PTS lactose/cellobiose transporter subunit 
MAESSEEEQQLMQAMGLITNAGNAKSLAMEAIHAAHDNDFTEAQAKIDEANKALIEAHNMQTKMLTAEANGQHSQLTLLTVHSQDHLMTAITFIDLAQELIKVYHKLADSDSK